MLEIFVKETGELLLGGNLGVLAFDYVTGLLNGWIDKWQIGEGRQPLNLWAKASVNTLVKGLGGAAIMMASTKVSDWNEDVGQIVLGVGAGPIMTIGSDWLKAGLGTDLQTYGYAQGRGVITPLVAPGVPVTVPIAVRPVVAPMVPIATADALKVGVF